MNNLYTYLLMLGDNSMILGHRLSQLCGHGPNLETDIALTNISLDLYGQVRSYFQYAAKVSGNPANTEDSIAFLRYERQYLNGLLVEQPNTDFAFVILRQALFDIYHLYLLEALESSKDTQIAAIATKSIKEVKYHQRFSSSWVKRLGDGTEISHQKAQYALDTLHPYSFDLLNENAIEADMKEQGIGADLHIIKEKYQDTLKDLMVTSTLTLPDNTFAHKGGKEGVHSEHMGFILSDLQYMQRAYPNMQW